MTEPKREDGEKRAPSERLPPPAHDPHPPATSPGDQTGGAQQ